MSDEQQRKLALVDQFCDDVRRRCPPTHVLVEGAGKKSRMFAASTHNYRAVGNAWRVDLGLERGTEGYEYVIDDTGRFGLAMTITFNAASTIVVVQLPDGDRQETLPRDRPLAGVLQRMPHFEQQAHERTRAYIADRAVDLPSLQNDLARELHRLSA